MQNSRTGITSHGAMPRLIAAFAFLLLCLFPSAASAQTVTTYTDTTSTAINNGTTCSAPLVRNFTSTAAGLVSDVDLGMFATHSFRGDIRMTLQSPTGTRVQLVNGNSNNVSGDNYNVMLSDENTTTVNTDGNTVNHSTTAPLPYANAFRPNAPLSGFDGETASGTWRLEVCDIYPSSDNGTFLRADLTLTTLTSFADLSLTKTVSNASPASGASISYTLAVTNSSTATQTANSVTVLDQLPLGVSFVSASGFGSYSSSTGVWTVGSIPAGTTRTITINVTVTAGSGRIIQNGAEVSASSVNDLDSTPNNGSTTEDDDAFVSFTTTGSRAAGTPPTLVCPNGTALLDWNAQSWTSGSSTGTANVANIGVIGFNVTTQGTFSVPLQLNATITGGTTGQNSLYQNVEYTNRSQTTTTTVTLPTAVPGTQFTIFDVDYNDNDFADKMTITGSFNGSPVTPTLTNGISNYVFGNVAIGDVIALDTTNEGNVIVTFSAPVDTITIIYGNHTTAPADPDGQAIAINDFTFCRPVANLSVTKISNVVSDNISGTNPKAISGAVVNYCILVTNAGSGTATNLSIGDAIPGNVTFVPGTIRSGSSCPDPTTVEDDDASDSGEPDSITASVTGSNLAAATASLGPSASFSIAFHATIN